MKPRLVVRLSDIKPFAEEIVKQLRGGEILALMGPLGSGKTTFAKALAKELKVQTAVTSPTYTLMHVHAARLPAAPERKRGGPDKNKVYFYHLDLYRTKNFQEVKALGLTEIWGQPDTITLIEWADKIAKHLPKKSMVIKFSGDTNTPTAHE